MPRYAAAILLTCLVTAVTMGQEYRGTILGHITDPSGASIVGASIEVTNVETETKVGTTSNEAGNFRVPFLLPGDYAVRVEQAGFKTMERRGIRVSVGSEVAVNMALSLGSTSDSVTVTASAPLLNTTGADLGQVVENPYIRNVDFFMTRNVGTLVHLSPGVTGTPQGTYTVQSYQNYSINGGGSTRGANEYLIDGIPNTVAGGVNGVLGATVFMPSMDAVEEFKVHTTMFDASLGRSNGGAVSITTRGGTNELHGTIYAYKRWAALNANGWSANRLGLDRPAVSYWQGGFAVGGPVWIPKLIHGKNRTFFSAAVERDRDVRGSALQARVPSEAERQGDFSRTLNPLGGPLTLFDPASSVVTGSTVRRQLFPDARIPLSRLNPTGVAILALYPLPNQPVAPQASAMNWGSATTTTVSQGMWSGRVDHVLSDRQRLFSRLGYLTRRQIPDIPYPGYAETPDAKVHLWNFGADDTIIISPSFVASLRMGVVRRSRLQTTGAVGNDPQKIKLPDILARNQYVTGWPNMRLGEGLFAMGGNTTLDGQTLYSGAATFTKLTGNQNTKFGADYRVNRANIFYPGASALGDFTFNNTFTRSDPFTATSGNTSGSSLASLLLGLPASGSFGYTSPLSLQNHYLALFVQNDWRVNSRLTLNVGLRWEVETPYTERYNRMTYAFDEKAKLPVQAPGFDLRGGVLFAGVNGNPRRGGNTDWNNFGPRFGFAYTVARDTVIRGGYGIFYAAMSSNVQFHGEIGVFDAVTPFVGSIDNGATAYATLANPFPSGLRAPAGSSAGLMAQVGDALSVFDVRHLAPYNEQWQFSVQRALPSRILAEAAYVGVLSLKGPESFNLNEKPDQYLALGKDESKAVPNPFVNAFPATSALGQGATVPQSRLWVQYPQFTTLTVQGVPTARAIYHALQTKVEKRMTRGLNVLYVYTYSKLMDNNTTSIVNERHYRSISSLDQKHMMRVAFVYQIPFRFPGSGWRKVARQTISGWELGGNAVYASGVPLSVTQANGRPLRIRNPQLNGPVGDRLGDHRDPKTGKVLNPYFDIDAFVPLASQYVVTPEPPALDELRAPSEKSVSANLHKMFTLRERLKLELNLEVMNLTNTPYFDAPGTNMSNAATFGVIRDTGTGGGIRKCMGALRLRF